VIAHFLLYTGWGSVVMVAAAAAVVGLVVWYAVATLCGLIASASWRLYRSLAR
jgi:hypothetical protein